MKTIERSTNGRKTTVRKLVKKVAKALHTISVKVDANRISVSSRSKTLKKTLGDEVIWNCTGGTMSITWPGANGSPFNLSPFGGGAKSSIASGPVVGGAGIYKYTITIYPDTSPTAAFSIDPQIEVDEGATFAPITDARRKR